jgi:F0F1-type ATP synthase assembly protein I
MGNLPPAFDLALRWGLTLAIAVLAGFFLGRWIDTKLNTTPLFLLIGVLWGIGGSFYYLFLQVKQLQEKQDSENNEASPS